ncbi:Ms4527A family Cys-rich leader peptide [Mycobacterium paraffinicum]|uniref:Ms4527A family Cys-rich leader peptide n=1 Tax=Mycobacterium paraffinicum TaxID=53378 RepID=UPI003555F8C6
MMPRWAVPGRGVDPATAHDGRQRFPGFSHRRGQLDPNSAHREPIFGLVVWPPRRAWHNGRVTVAQPSLRIALVARRHIDLKRVCSCCCLP